MNDGGSWGSWVRGCAIGCGALVLVVLVLGALGVARVIRPLTSAVDTRAELESRFGTEDDYTPPASGALEPTRIEAFLHVRTGLVEACDRLAGSVADMAAMEELDGVEMPSRGEVWRRAAAATRSALRMGPLMGDLFERRNELLLAAGMGLGEYSYLYVVAYHDQLLAERPRTGILDGSPVNRRIHLALQGMVGRQLDAARAAGLPASWIAELEHEHDLLAADSTRIPWQDGLPEAIRGSLEPYEDQLDGTFCAAATEIELLRNVRRTLGVESE